MPFDHARKICRERKEDGANELREKLLLAMGLTSVDQLDDLLGAPISPWAADHSESPGEEYALADQMYEEADRQRDARNRFNALAECKYLC